MSFKAYIVSLTKNKIELEEAFDKLKKADESWYFDGVVKNQKGERFAMFTIDRHIEDVVKIFPYCEQRAVSHQDIDTKRFIPIKVEDSIWKINDYNSQFGYLGVK